ncbi:MAG: agmatinase [Marinilabiliales bacterium]|nr:MAG: agmatinase [Marinilabiliales bacterium]
MRTFGGIEPEYGSYENADILLQPIIYDGTSTWGKGADNTLEAFLHASENMELYDIETKSEVYKRGIHLLPSMTGFSSPEEMFKASYSKTQEHLKSGKFLTFLGGEHSISIGIIKAFYEKYPDVSILQLDAHADLRPEYLGTQYNHACALYDASQNTNLVQVGIRSMDISEVQYMNEKQCFFAHAIHQDQTWMNRAIDKLGENVYITVDLDVFDPSELPGTGTPEPGGLSWNTITTFLSEVFKNKNVLGFDIVELAPIPGMPASEFLTSKLYYKMLSYKYHLTK